MVARLPRIVSCGLAPIRKIGVSRTVETRTTFSHSQRVVRTLIEVNLGIIAE
jgi:hypothetical protein